MVQQRLHEWIKHPELLNRETLYELRTLLAHYPYFQTARLLYLKNLFLLHDIAFGAELRKSALYLANRRVLFSLVEGEHYTLKALEKPKEVEESPDADRTLSLIDSFLASLPEEPAAPAIITLPVEAASDYTAYLMQKSDDAPKEEEAGPKMKGQEWIDNFLEKSEEQPLIPSVVEEEEDENPEKMVEVQEDESYFTETLAKIYVKQQRYSKALEIITRLNLKYPEKNAYFADQIRFLEKLIINTKQK